MLPISFIQCCLFFHLKPLIPHVLPEKATEKGAKYGNDVQPSKCFRVLTGLLRRLDFNFTDDAINVDGGKFCGSGVPCVELRYFGRDPLLLGFGVYIGVHRRNLNGRHWRISGSNAVLFYPHDIDRVETTVLQATFGGRCGVCTIVIDPKLRIGIICLKQLL